MPLFVWQEDHFCVLDFTVELFYSQDMYCCIVHKGRHFVTSIFPLNFIVKPLEVWFKQVSYYPRFLLKLVADSSTKWFPSAPLSERGFNDLPITVGVNFPPFQEMVRRTVTLSFEAFLWWPLSPGKKQVLLCRCFIKQSCLITIIYIVFVIAI